jgi:hypothetical protein
MMNWKLLVGALGFTLAAGAASAQNSPASKVAAQKGWHADLASAKATAAKSGKPLLVVFRCDP